MLPLRGKWLWLFFTGIALAPAVWLFYRPISLLSPLSFPGDSFQAPWAAGSVLLVAAVICGSLAYQARRRR
jgi:hypothetical protein